MSPLSRRHFLGSLAAGAGAAALGADAALAAQAAEPLEPDPALLRIGLIGLGQRGGDHLW